MSLSHLLTHLYSLTPNGIELGLDRVRAVAARLSHPEQRFPVIQVAGTNGKGTVCALLAHAAQSAGLKVGLFTSPHLHRFSERIRVNGLEADDRQLETHLARVFKAGSDPDEIRLTFFEVATLAALSIFAENRVDLAILEVGLGGRLDATSVAAPCLTAVTSIGLDHQAYLGDTLSEIAKEKAAIARSDVPLVLGRLDRETLRATQAVARAKGAPIERLGEDFDLPSDITPRWPGQHQRDNTAVAWNLFRHMARMDSRCTTDVFKTAARTVNWPGRFEHLGTRPEHVLDCAHNPAAVAALAQTLEETGMRPDTLIFGALKDKPGPAMLAALRPFVQQVVLMPPPISRACDPHRLAHRTDHVCPDAPSAIERADRLTREAGAILTTGSIFTVAAVRAVLLDEQTDPPVGL